MKPSTALVLCGCFAVLLGCLTALAGLAIIGTQPDPVEHLTTEFYLSTVAVVCVVAAGAFTGIVDIIITEIRR